MTRKTVASLSVEVEGLRADLAQVLSLLQAQAAAPVTAAPAAAPAKTKATKAALDRDTLKAWEVPDFVVKSLAKACAVNGKVAQCAITCPQDMSDAMSLVTDGGAHAAILDTTWRVVNAKGQEKGVGTLMFTSTPGVSAAKFVAGGQVGGVTVWEVTHSGKSLFVLKHKGDVVVIRDTRN